MWEASSHLRPASGASLAGKDKGCTPDLSSHLYPLVPCTPARDSAPANFPSAAASRTSSTSLPPRTFVASKLPPLAPCYVALPPSLLLPRHTADVFYPRLRSHYTALHPPPIISAPGVTITIATRKSDTFHYDWPGTPDLTRIRDQQATPVSALRQSSC